MRTAGWTLMALWGVLAVVSAFGGFAIQLLLMVVSLPLLVAGAVLVSQGQRSARQQEKAPQPKPGGLIPPQRRE